MAGGPVSVCGVGAVTGYGWGRKRLWDGLLEGESAVIARSGFADVLGHDVAWGAWVPDEAAPGDEQSRFVRAMSFAADEAVQDAVTRGWRPGPVVGVVHAIVLGEVDRWREFYTERSGRMSKREYLHLMPSTPLSLLMQRHDFHGPCMCVSAMCASGNAAMLTAKAWLDRGVVSDVLVVATDVSATPENIRHFVDLGVLVVDRPPFDACRPFQEGSRGFTLGEASVAFVLSGRRDGAYMSLRGGAMTQDGFHVVSIDPNHREIRRCFELALHDAGVPAESVQYLNAHGPGTQQCDTAEAEMLDTLFPAALGVFSVKPLTGHCQAAASAVELAASCLAYDRGVIPAAPPVAPGHPRLVPGAVPWSRGTMLKSSIGMGGYNSVVVLDSP